MRREPSGPVPSLALFTTKVGYCKVPGQNGRKINGAVEDVRFAVKDNESAIKYQEANDQLNSALDTSIDSIFEESGNEDDDDTNIIEPEELGTTHNLCVGEKIEVC